MGMTTVVFGATGTAGSAVVRRCLADERISEVRAVTRRPLGWKDPRLVEVACADFTDLRPISDALTGIAGCFFCLGMSSSHVDEYAYRAVIVGYAVAAAQTLRTSSPEHTFHFISGRGTSATSRYRWARVKAEAEDRLLGLDLHRLLIYRPGYIHPAPDRHPGPSSRALAAFLRRFPSLMISADDLARAMANLQLGADGGVTETILENRAIKRYASLSTR